MNIIKNTDGKEALRENNPKTMGKKFLQIFFYGLGHDQ
jgi:hypothetical protein